MSLLKVYHQKSKNLFDRELIETIEYVGSPVLITGSDPINPLSVIIYESESIKREFLNPRLIGFDTTEVSAPMILRALVSSASGSLAAPDEVQLIFLL